MKIKSHPNRLLLEHTIGVYKLMNKEVKNAAKYIDFEKLFGVSFSSMKTIIKAIAYFHDVGKATTFFQKKIRNEKVDKELSQHSLLGFVAVINYLIKHMKKKEEFAIPLAAIVVRQHHSKALSPFGEALDISNQKEKILIQEKNLSPEYIKDLSNYIEKPNFSLDELSKNKRKWKMIFVNKSVGLKGFMLYNYLSSLLTWADRTDAAFQGHVPFKRKTLPENMVKQYRHIMRFDKAKTLIDKIRNEFFNESKKINHFDIATLRGRTGIGKTLTAFSVALERRKEIQKAKGYTPRIIYCLPFLSIIDQTYDNMVNILKTTGVSTTQDVIMQQHHLASIDILHKSKGKKADKHSASIADILLNSWNSEIVITTFNSFFQSIFTDKRNMRFFRIPGSIIILDEVQTVPIKYWLLIKETLEMLSKYAGTKIIFSTATMPKSFLVNSKQLVRNDFKFDRFDVIQLGEMNFDEFKSKIVMNYLEQAKRKNKSLMIVMNTISSAEEVYKSLPGKNKNYFYLSSHLPPFVRKKVISKIIEKKGFHVLVTTQIVEAGVDIDFDYCIRDFGPLDSIVQTSGRVNRSFEKQKGKVFVPKIFKKHDGSIRFLSNFIYDSALLDLTRRILNKRKFSENQIYEASEKYFEELEKMGFKDESYELLEALEKLDFDKISEFKLIDDKKLSINVFLEINKNAKKLWGKYCDLLRKKIPFENKYDFISEKKQIIKELEQYVVNIRINRANLPNLPPLVHGFYYVSSEQLDNYYDKKIGFHSGEVDIY